MVISFLQILILLLLIYIITQFNIKLLARLIYSIHSARSTVLKMLAFLFLPGTLIHELGHMLTAELLMVRTDDLNLVPELKEQNSFQLGGVKIEQTDAIRKTIIGLAPVFVGLIIVWVITSLWVSLGGYIWYKLLYIYLLFQIGHTMFSSRQDLQGALIGLIFISLIFVLGFFLNQIIILPLFIQLREAVYLFIQNQLPLLVRGLLNTLIIILVFTGFLFIMGLWKRKI